MTTTVSGAGLLQDTDALFLDFDGTLAPIQDDPGSVHLAPGMDDVLERVSARLGGALAILSGRALSDLARRVPASVWRFGNHGLYAAAPGEEAPTLSPETPADLMSAITAAAGAFESVHVEPKGPVVAIHYRAAPDAGPPLGDALAAAIAPIQGYSVQHGKFVFEAKPDAANKGICLSRALQSAPFQGRRPVMIGDDTTDEDAFLAAQKAGGIAIKVGNGSTHADYRLETVAMVHRMLKEHV